MLPLRIHFLGLIVVPTNPTKSAEFPTISCPGKWWRKTASVEVTEARKSATPSSSDFRENAGLSGLLTEGLKYGIVPADYVHLPCGCKERDVTESRNAGQVQRIVIPVSRSRTVNS